MSLKDKMKSFTCSILLSLLLLIPFSSAKAQADVSSEASVSYKVSESGKTEVKYEIQLKNIFTDRYAKSYTLQLDRTEPQKIVVTENGTPLEFTTQTLEQTKQITVTFPDPVVGKNNTRTFEIAYQDTSLAHKNGDVWDVSIPRLGNPESFRSYTVELTVPETFGKPAYISPHPSSQEDHIYIFTKEHLASTGVHAAFGTFQTYDLNLKYVVENPLQKKSSVEIAFPPDTSYQRIYLMNLDPRPEKLVSDQDGNWIATYSLEPRQQLTVNMHSLAQVFNSPIQSVEIDDDTLALNTKATTHWQSDSEEIKMLARKYSTPEEIYRYVVRTLQYDKNRIVPNAERLGAVKALENPRSALCTEFTDLFVAIARAAGIPAREVNGYAYSDNSASQPLSLVTDVLHAWPEYWDTSRRTWIAVDPTWENTTGGVDYFHEMDLRHIAFAIHGKDDTLPYPAGSYKLGTYPEKNVEVSVGNLPENRESSPEIQISASGGFPLFKQQYTVTIINPGPGALYDIPSQVVYGDKQQTLNIDALLPYGSYKSSVNIPVGFLAKDMPDSITAQSGGSNYSIKTNKANIALYHSVTILLFILAITAGVFIYNNPWRRS